MPFVVRIWIAFLACLVIGVAVSLVTAPPREDRPVQLSGVRFAAKPVFNPASLWRLSPF
jgi:SSS family solute:Na+ symporter